MSRKMENRAEQSAERQVLHCYSEQIGGSGDEALDCFEIRGASKVDTGETVVAAAKVEQRRRVSDGKVIVVTATKLVPAVATTTITTTTTTTAATTTTTITMPEAAATLETATCKPRPVGQQHQASQSQQQQQQQQHQHQHQQRRPSLRKQGSSSRRLDSCASSDSGHGTNSNSGSSSLAACSSLVSVANGGDDETSASTTMPTTGKLPANSSASPSSSSSSPSSSTSSSSTASSSSCNSSSSFASSCSRASSSTSSSSPQQQQQHHQQQQQQRQLQQQQSMQLQEQLEPVDGEQVAASAVATVTSGARRRQSWLMSFGELARDCTALTTSVAPTTDPRTTATGAVVSAPASRANHVERAQVQTVASPNGGGCGENASGAQKNGNDYEASTIAAAVDPVSTAKSVYLPDAGDCSATASKQPTGAENSNHHHRRRQKQHKGQRKRPKSLVIGGQVKRVHFFPSGTTGAQLNPEVASECHQCSCAPVTSIAAAATAAKTTVTATSNKNTTVGHLVVCLDVNERERRQVMKSRLLRSKMQLAATTTSREQVNSSDAKRAAGHFWRLVASESSTSCDENDDKIGDDNYLDERTCPLVRLIQAADCANANNRPQLLLPASESRSIREPNALAEFRSVGAADNGQQLQQQQLAAETVVQSSSTAAATALRLNSIDEEEVCLTQLNSSSAELEFSYSSSSSSSSSSSESSDLDSSEDPDIDATTTTTSSNSDSSLASLAALQCSDDDDADELGSLEMTPSGDLEAALGRHSNGLVARSSASAHGARGTNAGAESQSRTDRLACDDDDDDDESLALGQSNEESSSAGGDNGQAAERQRREIRDDVAADEDAAEEEEHGDDDDDDDDYFYDDELAFAASNSVAGSSIASTTNSGNRKRAPNVATELHPAPQCAALGPTRSMATTTISAAAAAAEISPQTTQLLGNRQAALQRGHQLHAMSRPLLMWAPTVRRTSCPVGGQLAAFASWRQLWSALPGAGSNSNNNSQPTGGQLTSCGFVCNNCLRTVQQQQQQQQQPAQLTHRNTGDTQASLMRLIQQQQQQQQQHRPASPALGIANSERKASQHSLFSVRTSDYFSSFDQTEPPSTSWLSVATCHQQQQQQQEEAASTGRCQQRVGQQRTLVPAPGVAGRNAGAGAGAASASSGSNELRRQSTITGFDHYKYQAPRSPSLCLPAAGNHPGGRLQRQSAQLQHQQHPNQQHQHQQKPYLLSAYQQQQQQAQHQRLSPTHSTGGSSSPSPTHWQQQQQAAILSASQLQQQQQATGYLQHQQPTVQPFNQSRGSLRGFARARLESLESDRGSSPSWSASTSSLRSSSGCVGAGSSAAALYALQRKLSGNCANPSTCSPGNWCPQCNPHTPLGRAEKFRQQGAKQQSHLGALAAATAQRPYEQQVLGGQQVQLVPQQQQQAVYFFLCCCQRRKSPGADAQEHEQEQAPAPAPEPEPTDEQVAAGPAAASAGNSQRRRVSLVARPAIVGAYDSSGNLRHSNHQSQRQQQQQSAEDVLMGLDKLGSTQVEAEAGAEAEDGQQAAASIGVGVEASRGRDAEVSDGQQAAESATKQPAASAASPAPAPAPQSGSPSISEQLKVLLERLDEIQRQAALQRSQSAARHTDTVPPETATAATTPTPATATSSATIATTAQRAERQLLDAIKQRLAETERLLALGHLSSATGPLASRGSDPMRYSTPNLLVSYNFEHIMRLREKRAREEAAEELDTGDPPEAAEAWFLSRSPAGGGRSPSSGAARGTQMMAQRQLSRDSIRSSTSRNVTDARTVCIIDGDNDDDDDNDDDQQLRARRRRSTGASMASQSQQTLANADQCDKSAPTTRGGDQQHQQQQQTPNANVSRAESAPMDKQARRKQIDGDGPTRDSSAAANVASTAGQAPLYCPQQVALSQVSGLVHDKSMAQARYLYSTLTSNTTALLCAAGSSGGSAGGGGASGSGSGGGNAGASGSSSGGVANKSSSGAGPAATAATAGGSKAAAAGSSSLSAGQSPSPTRAHGIQRKQAQFVADRHSHQQQQHQQQHSRLLVASGRPMGRTVAKTGGGGEQVAEGESSERIAGKSAVGVGATTTTTCAERVLRKRAKVSAMPDGGDSDSSSSSGGANDYNDHDDDYRRRRTDWQRRAPTDRDDSDIDPADADDADDLRRTNSEDNDANEEPGAAAAELKQLVSRQQTPSIVESQYDALRRQSQGSRQTSRSNSVATGADTPVLVSQHSTGQLQPSSMDPAMHALWAQGADLDTGNGNFIMATRRRRSVHALHQVHQIQQQQQQQQLQGKQLAGSLGPSKSFASSSGDQQQQVSGGAYRCYKIDERARGSRARPASQEGWTSDEQQAHGARTSGSSTPGAGSAPMVHSAAIGARNLKSELKKLRATSSIDETLRGASQRARFVSAPTPASRISPSATASFVLGQVGGAEEQLESAMAVEREFPLEAEEDDENDDDYEGEVKREQVQVESRRLIEQEPRCADSGSGSSTIGKDQEESHEHELEKENDNEEPADSQRVYYCEDIEYELSELESSSSMLANLYDWNYPIFELSERYGKSILSKLSYRIFSDSGFFDSFKIPKQAFFNFFHALEEGYHNKPYHNRLHAADVLHAVYYLTSQPIDNFCQVPLDLIEHYDDLLNSTRRLNHSDKTNVLTGDENQPQHAAARADFGEEFVTKLHNHIVAIVVAAAAAADDSELPFGIMGANLTALEVMALYTAAAMHDFQHPGRTNSFLVATSSPLALLYNDRSVLESHHSAAAWALFYRSPAFNWLCNLEKDEFKRFRFMIIELILATDLMRHYELVSAFNKKLNNVGRHNIDWFCESDRLLVMEIIIKLADVNGPMKGHQLHCQWTDRIAMEFYEQGDEERALNLPVSLYMDRSDPRLPELQKSFINHLVGPLSHSYAAAGFFPRSTDPNIIEQDDSEITGNEGSNIENGERSVYNQSKYWLIEDSNGCELNKQFLRCTQTLNLRNNFLYWDAKSKEKHVTSKAENQVADLEDNQSSEDD